MKAVLLTRIDPIEKHPLQLQETANPMPAPGEILLQVTACGVCRSNLHMIEGEWISNGVPAKLPIVPGHEIVGRVAAVGDGIARFKPGDRAGIQPLWSTCGRCEYCLTGREQLCQTKEITGETVDGGYAEYVLARAEHAYAVPESIPDAEAAPLFCPGITAYGAIAKAHLAPGKKVVLFGMGGVGHLVLQFARLSGAEVIVVSRSGRYLRLAEAIGGFALHYERGTENFRNIDRYGGTGLPVIRESGDCSRQRQKHHYRGTIKKTGVFPVNHIVVAKKQILENNPWRRLSSTKRSADRSSWHSSSRVQSGPATFSSSSCLCILRSHYWSL